MEQHRFDSPQPVAVPMLAKSGFVNSGGGGGIGFETGLGEVLLSVVLGAFFGLILGMVVTNLMRYFSLIAGRSLGGHCWTIYGALIGALIFGWISLADEEG